MKPSRLARRFNKKGRQEKKILIQEQNPSTNVIVEGETTTADNNSILPSKKRTTRVVREASTVKRKLSKKERKRLEKVLDVKKKKAQRVELLDKLGQVQINNDELALLHSVKHIGSKTKRQPLDLPTLTNAPSLNLNHLSRKRPAPVSTETIERTPITESSSSDDDEDPTINDEDIRHALLPSQAPVPPPPVIKRRQRESSTSSTEETKVAIPARPHANVFVERSEEIQTVRSQLPIITEEQVIMEAIHDNLVVLICGETGSGKTTQLPQFLYEAGYTVDGKMIGITEPRRVAAVSMASRVAHELNLTNDKVSYQIRYEGTYKKETTSIKFMTDGVLLKEVQNDFLLSNYSCILIDEAHDRSVATDVLIGLLSRIVPIRCRRNDPLRLVIMSATMRIEEFVNNRHLFKLKPQIINIDARQYPVTIHFNKQTPKNYIEEAFKKVSKIHRQLPSGGILVFVTGQQEVQTLCHRLRKKFPLQQSSTSDKDEPRFKSKNIRKKNRLTAKETSSTGEIDDEELEHLQSDIEEEEGDTEKEDALANELDEDDDEEEEFGVEGISSEPLYVLPLYAILSSDKQARVFDPPPSGTRLCVIATNVAETSITISSVKYIVDCGKVKTKYYDKLTGVSTFRIEWTSKASANQRTGRAGRTAPGHCYRLYSSAVFNDSFSDYTSPEIVRKPVEDLVLQLKTLNIDRLANFPFPTAPDLKAINVAEQILVQLNALDRRTPTKKITELGRRMSTFPINPRYSKMLVIAQENPELLPYVIALVASLSVNEVLTSGLVKIQKDNQETNMNLDDLRRQWIGQGESLLFGDMMVLLKAVGAIDHQSARNDLSICQRYGFRPKAMTEIRKIRRQLIQIVKTILPETAAILDARLLPPNEQQLYLLRKVLAAGMVDRLAKRIDGTVMHQGHKVTNAYQTLLLEEPVFIHPSSVLINDLPPFVCYQELHETSRIFIKNICAIQMEWIVQLNPHLCSFSAIEETPSPRYDEKQDKMVCHRKATIGQRVSWSLGSAIETVFPINTNDRYRWFGKLFLDGVICPRLLQFQPALLCSSNAMVKSWATLMERTQIFLNALIAKEIDSRAQLTEIWTTQPKYLLDVYCSWLPESLHPQARSVWPPLPFVLSK